MELVLRVVKARQGHESRFHEDIYRHEIWQALIDETGATWELADDVPRYKTQVFSSSCEPVIANFDHHDNCLHIEKKGDIEDYLLWHRVQAARTRRVG